MFRRSLLTGGLAFLTVVGACSKVETKDIYSPDRSLILRIETNTGGGAAVTDRTTVYILLANPTSAGKSLIFVGSAMSDFSADWHGKEAVALSYSEGYVTDCNPTPTLSTGKKMIVLGCK